MNKSCLQTLEYDGAEPSLKRFGGNDMTSNKAWLKGFFSIFFLILLCQTVPASAEESVSASSTEPAELTLTMDEAIQLAVERNRGLLNQRLNRETQRFALDVAQDRYRPEFSASSNSGHDRNDDTADVRFGAKLRVPTGGNIGLEASESISGDDESEMVPTLSFSQPLLKGAGVRVDGAPLTQARISEKLNILGFRETVSELIVTTITAYRSLIQAFREVEISEASLLRAEQQLEVTRSLIQAGQVARREITRSEATVANRELALVRSRNNLDSANFSLINTLDLDSSTRIQPRENLSIDQIDSVDIGQIDLLDSIDTALSNRPDYLKAKLQVETSEIALHTAQNNKLPDLSLNFNVARNRALKRNDYQVRLNLVVPLNDRGPTLALRRAENSLVIARRNLEELRESIGISVRQAINDVEIGYKVMELATAARKLAENNLAIEQSKFSQGLSSTFEVSSSEDNLVSAQNSETDAIISYLNALVRLDQAMGRTLDTWGFEVEDVTQ